VFPNPTSGFCSASDNFNPELVKRTFHTDMTSEIKKTKKKENKINLTCFMCILKQKKEIRV
jgi:hypothetical protein